MLNYDTKKCSQNHIDGSQAALLYFMPPAGDARHGTPRVVEADHPCPSRPAAYNTTLYDNDLGARTAGVPYILGEKCNEYSSRMQSGNKEVVQSLLNGLSKNDPSITQQKIEAVIKLLEDAPKDEILSREEVARRFRMSVKAVDYHCRMGHFRRVRIGSSKRARGISLASVEAATITR